MYPGGAALGVCQQRRLFPPLPPVARGGSGETISDELRERKSQNTRMRDALTKEIGQGVAGRSRYPSAIWCVREHVSEFYLPAPIDNFAKLHLKDVRVHKTERKMTFA